MEAEVKAFEFFSHEFWVVGQYVLPLLMFFLMKNYFLNFVAYVIIKLNTSYQFQNNFCMDEKRCQIMAIRFQYVVVIDVDTEEYTQIENRQFVKMKIWHKPPRRKPWTDSKRNDHRKNLKDK